VKKCLIGLIVIITFVACSVGVAAAPPHHPGPNWKHGPDDRQLSADAWYVISRTWTVSIDAEKNSGRNNHTFNLAQDCILRARTLYMNHDCREAIFLALRARKLFFRVIEERGKRPEPYYYPDEKERHYLREGRMEREF
jgi:hypothetical protein